jgi:tetratricopeptide (TPR) repeat protein
VFWPLVLGLRARVYENAGQLEVALGYLRQSIEIAGEPGVTQISLLVQRADLEAAMADRDAARATLQYAIEISQAMKVRMEELRAATRLVRLSDGKDIDQSLNELRTVYDQFSEGFDSPPLRDAASLLEPSPARA